MQQQEKIVTNAVCSCVICGRLTVWIFQIDYNMKYLCLKCYEEHKIAFIRLSIGHVHYYGK